METKDNGGPAFPLESMASGCYHGMTLLDYFAAHAPFTVTPSVTVRDDAYLRYQWASAMLEARDA